MKGFVFSYWVGKVITVAAFVLPIVFQFLPQGWENITLGAVLHGLADYLNRKYHAA